MRLKIISDGTVDGTKVVSDETGELIDYVEAITWTIDAHSSNFAHGVFRVVNVPVEIVSDFQKHRANDF